MKAGAWVTKFCKLLAIVSFFTLFSEVSRHGNEFIISKITPPKLLGRNENISFNNSNSTIETQWVANTTSDSSRTDLFENIPAMQQTSVVRDPEEKFAARRELVRQSCRRHGKWASYHGDWQDAVFKRLRWLKTRDLVVCFSAKVGTSTWSDLLLRDKFQSEYVKLIQKPNFSRANFAEKFLKPEFPKQRERVVQQLLSSSKVLNVRHPFVRIVSAFRDKFEPCLSQSDCYAKRYVKEWQSLLTFKSFVEYVVRTNPVFTEANVDTFNLFDRHWRPFYLNCATCDIEYDYVVKMETWDEDMRYILTKFGFEQDEHLHSNRKDSDAVALEYIKALPQSLVIELYKRYAIDFDLFGYTVDKYLK